MSFQEIALQKSGGYLPVTNRSLGTIGMILSPMLFIASFLYAPQFDRPGSHPFLASLGGILYLLGAMAAATAMRNLRVTGQGTGAIILYFVQMTGLFLAMWCDVLEYAAPGMKQTALFFVTDMAYPFSHLLMNVVGVAVIRAGVWRGWKKIPAFLVGLALPAFIGLSAIAGREDSGFIFPLMVTIGFFSLGLAVASTKKNLEKT